MAKKVLNLVDDNDNIIGVEDRNIIHEKGLLHREVHVHFVTPENEIIFQHRAKNKDTYPNLLDATVGGHVEIGDSYEESAIKETFEETGIAVSEKDLILFDKIHKKSKDEVTGMTNHAFQKEFVYIYKGNIDDLKVEDGKALGFVVFPIDKLLNLSKEEKSKFIPYIYGFITTRLIEFIRNNIKIT